MSGIFYPGRLLPDATVAGCIDIFENAWPNPEETIEAMEMECANPESGVSWEKATTMGDGAYQKIRTNYHLGISSSADKGSAIAQNIHNQMYMLLLAALEPYKEKYGIHENLWHEPYNMLRYRGGQEYKAHYDGGTESGRCVSAIVYLNNDYEGGHVEFTNFGVKIKPEPGMLLLFPSSYPYTHIAHPVTSGTKYAIVTWTHDRPMR
jgi:predicted 2-oxoglutarate/Fe(II)-dependent dioxygenase YbiX